MITRQVTVTGLAANELAQRFLALCGGQPKTTIEIALVIAYAMVAEGVAHYPEKTRSRRASLFVEQGTAALCDVIKRVGELPDELLAVKSPDTTCGN